MSRNTQAVANEVGCCESVEEFEQLARNYVEHNGWSDTIRALSDKYHLRTTGIAAAIGRSESTAKNHLKTIPKDRADIIAMAALMGLSVDETNRLLTRWGRKRALYPKVPEDFIWIYILSTGGSVYPKKLHAEYTQVYEQLQAEARQPSGYRQKRVTEILLGDVCRTGRLRSGCAQQDLPFHDLVRRDLPDMGNAYFPLRDFLKRRLGAFLNLSGESVNSFFSSNPAFRSKYNEMIPPLFKSNQSPDNRDVLIVLGLWACMDTDSINRMLELAKMGPLNPKDLVESVILYHLENLCAENPSIFSGGGWYGQDDISIELKDTQAQPSDLRTHIRQGLETSNLIREFGHEQKSRIDDFLKWL